MKASPPRRISARDNQEFKRFLAVRARKISDRILVDGPKLVLEAIRSGLTVEALAVAGSMSGLVVETDAPRFEFSAPLLKSLSDVETSQGVIAIMARPHFGRLWLEGRTAFVLVLDGLQDPGNVGTLFRTAEAAGVSGILLTRGCADPLSAKALRASAGSAFRLPHLADLAVGELRGLLGPQVQLVAAVAAQDASSVFDATLIRPLALALGSEGSGLHPDLEALASIRVRVPHAPQVESLNVAAAGAIVMFEIARRAG